MEITVLYCKIESSLLRINAIVKNKDMIYKMKIIPLILLVLLSTFHRIYGQDNPLDKIVSIDVNNVSLKEAINTLKSNQNIDVSYSNEVLISNKKISLKIVDTKVSDILERLLEGHDIEYKVLGKKLVLYKNVKKTEKIENRSSSNYSISGYIEDLETGEKLIGANIYVHELGTGVSTNVHGYYSLTLPEGQYNLDFTYIGFQMDKESIDLTN